jgi:hypothetical protein
MENRVVALAVLENLIHWPLPHRSGYVAPSNVAEDGGEEEHYSGNTVSAGDADDLQREPRQRKLDRYRAVLLLPHLCHKLGSRWVESEVVPYLLRCVEEDDAQLSLVSGLALLGVTMPRRGALGPSSAASPTTVSSETTAAEAKPGATPSTPSPTNAASPTTTGGSGSGSSANAYLSLDDVQPVCALLAASGTEETRAFAAQVVLPHLYFGTGLERDVTLESWDLKFVPLSVLHADMIAANSGGGGGEDDSSSTAAAAADAAEEGGDVTATLHFISAVRKQLLRQRQLENLRRGQLLKAVAKGGTTAGDSDSSLSRNPSSRNASFLKTNAKDAAAAGVRALTDDDVRRRCQALVAEDEDMQFLFSGSYDTLTGPWGFSGCRLASLTQGAKALFASTSTYHSGGTNSHGSGKGEGGGGGSGAAAMSAGGGFHSFRRHERRVSGSQALRGAPPPSQRPLSDADLELYGASYAVDKGNEGCSSVGVAPCDDFFTVNVRARALVGDLARWMEALTPPTDPPAASPAESLTSPASLSAASAVPPASVSSTPLLFLPGQTLSLYDYLSHEGRRDALRSRWRAQLKLLQGLLESPYPGSVAVAVELISSLLHAFQFVMMEVEAYLQRGQGEGSAKPSSSPDGTPSAAPGMSTESEDAGEAQMWGIGVPSTPLLTTAQLQAFLFRTTRRHVAYCVAAAVAVRRVDVPPSLSASVPKAAGAAAAAAAAAWRAPTEALALLLRTALPVARKSLTDLLLQHHLIVQLNLPPIREPSGSAAGGNGSSEECVLLQIGAGPCESRVAALAAWDVSFTPSSSSTHTGPCIMPDDASFLLNTSAATEEEATGDNAAQTAALDHTPWLPGTLNAFSIFRVHRIIRRSVLRALPLAVDFLCLASPAADPSAGTTANAPTSSLFTLGAVCPMLLQVLVPPSTLPTLLRVLHAAAQLPEETATAVAAPKSQHVDPSLSSPRSLDAAVPHLWAAMTAAGSIMGTAEPATAAVQGQETPSSLDFELLEAALDAVQRLVAEAAVQLSTTSLPVQTAHYVCAQLFTLVAACVRWVPRYTSWKARWLIAQKLPRIIATFCFLLATVADTAVIDAAATGTYTQSSPAKPLMQVAVMWLQCTLQLLYSVWSCAEAFGVAPLNDLTDDEEVEVRCLAVRCAAFVFRRVVEAVLRIGAAVSVLPPPTASSVLPLLLPSLTEPLTQLLDATAQCVLVGANDVDPRVRCRAAEALAVLSRTLSMLVAVDDRRPSASSTAHGSDGNTNNGRSSKDAVWTRYLRSNTDALLRLMSDEKPAVQLALVSQLTDLLLMRMHQQRPSLQDKGKGSLMSSRGDVDNDDGQQRGADQVQREALLQCLRQLAQHELWRLREQYAVFLAHLCGRLLQTAMIQPRRAPGRLSAGGRAGTTGALTSSSPTSTTAAATELSEGASTSMERDASPYGHTHPLYQLARTELLTLLVTVLFDKVKAVRDAALDAVEKMCLQLAAATRYSNTSLQQDGAASSSLAGNVAGGAACTGRMFQSMISSSSALQNASGSGYNINTFVDNVLWPRINSYDKAWETYLSRSALLHIALRLRVDKTSVFIPLLDQLARDPVLNVRLVVAKIILEVLLRSSPDVYAMAPMHSQAGEEDGGAGGGEDPRAASPKPDLPSGTVAYRILMNKPAPSLTSGSGADSVLPPLQFTEEERTGVVLQILRQLLKDASSDVRDEAAKALKVCF